SQPVAADPIHIGGVVGDKIGDRNHPITPRHDGIVASLQRSARAIGIVKSRHEVAPGGTSGRAGAPASSTVPRSAPPEMRLGRSCSTTGGRAVDATGAMVSSMLIPRLAGI